MKIKVKEPAYYNDEYLTVGRIINFEGEIPSWATLADGIETKRNKQKAQEPQKQQDNTPDKTEKDITPASDEVKQKEEKTPVSDETNKEIDVIVAGDGGVFNAEGEEKNNTAVEQNVPDTPQMTSPEAEAYLELLINEGIEKNILIEDADKKTVKEQIEELEKALGRKKAN